MIISIDGPAGSGKSTVAKIISNKLNIIHFNSGSLYRGVAAYLNSINFDIKGITLDSPIPDFELETEFIDGVQHVFVNKIDFTSKLRNNEISILSPFVSSNRTVRQRIDNCQRAFGKKNSLVLEGRDIGSFVFPNAEYKFYLDCNIEERAKRRYKEEVLKNPNITFKDIKNEIAKRDYIDKTKQIAPLVVPENAIIIDSTNLTIEQVADKILSHIKN